MSVVHDVKMNESNKEKKWFSSKSKKIKTNTADDKYEIIKTIYSLIYFVKRFIYQLKYF